MNERTAKAIVRIHNEYEARKKINKAKSYAMFIHDGPIKAKKHFKTFGIIKEIAVIYRQLKSEL